MVKNKNKTEKQKKFVSNTFMIIGGSSMAYGGYFGFCTAMGNPVPFPILLGPALFQAGLGITDGISVAKTGKQFTGNYANLMERDLEQRIKIFPWKTKKIYAAFEGGMGEGLAGGFETLVGYGVGYLTGSIIKLFS